jgi:putative aldouronate transport system permease protein
LKTVETIKDHKVKKMVKEESRSTLLYDFKRNKILLLMVAPVVIFFFINSYLPMVGIYYAFTRFNFDGGLFGSPFVGLENFKFLFQSGTLLKITTNTILYNLAFIVLGNLLQIFVAILLSELPGKSFIKVSQSVMFLPYFVSYVIVGVLVYNLFNYESGLVNTMLESFNFQPMDAYSTPWIWKFVLVALYIWKMLGYGTVIYLAAILGIGTEFYEAATIDGANIFQRIRHITIPMLMPTFIMLFLFSLGSIMRGQFDLFYQVIGQNGVLFDATDIIDTYVFRVLRVNFDIGMGTAAGLYQSVFGFIIIMTVNWLIRRNHEEYALF